MSFKFMVTLLLVAVIQHYNKVRGLELKKDNFNATRPQSLRNNNTNIEGDLMDDSSPYIEHQEHVGRGKTKVIMLKNKNFNNNNRKNLQNLQTKLQSQTIINNKNINNQNNNVGKAERFFLNKNSMNTQLQLGQRGVMDNRKVLGFITKPTIGTGIGGVNQPVGEIAIALPKRMKHLNIGLVRRPGRNKGGGGGGGGGGNRATTLKVPPESPEYPDYYSDQPAPVLPLAPGAQTPAPVTSLPDDTDLGNDYSEDYPGSLRMPQSSRKVFR